MQKFWKMLNVNWIDVFVSKWKTIPSVYIRSFVIVFVGINIAFAFHTFYFFIGNHDWVNLIHAREINTTLYDGRFSGYYLSFFLTGNHILPVLTNIYAFLGLSLGAIALCIYWKVPKTVFAYSVIGLLLSIQPYTLVWLYYSFSAIGQLWIPLCVIIAFLLSEQVIRCQSLRRKIIYIVIATLLFVFVFGVYPAVINMIAVVFLGRIIIDIFLESNLSFINMKRIFLQKKYLILTVFLGGLLFKSILIYLGVIGELDTSTYHVQTIAIKDLPIHFIKITAISFATFWNYPVAFFPTSLIRLFAIVFMLGIGIIILNILFSRDSLENENMNIRKKIIKVLMITLFTIALIIFSKTAAIMTYDAKAFVEPRILFFGDTFMHVFPIVLIFIQKFQFPKNIMIVISVVLINMCAIQDALALKVWKFGFEAEKMLWNRVITRIEEFPSFEKNRKYTGVFIGAPSYRQYYYYNAEKVTPIGDILHRSYAGVHTHSALAFFNPDLSFDGMYRRSILRYLKGGKKSKTLEIVMEMKKEINKAKVWPAKESVIIKDNIILIVFDQQELDEIKKLINK